MTTSALRTPIAAWILLAGGWWATAETTLGSALHAASSPLTGLAMGLAGLGATVAIARSVDRPGVVAGAAFVAAVAKLATAGALGVSPAIAIVLSGLVAELGLRRSGPILAMGLAGAYEAIHPWIFGRFVTGRSWAAILERAGALGVGEATLALVTATVFKFALFLAAGVAIARLVRSTGLR